MMFPKSFYDVTLSPIDSNLPLEDESASYTAPGQVYRDALAFGLTPEGVSGAIFDDDDSDLLDAAADLTVQKTDLVDRSFYRLNPEYATPASLNKRDSAPSISTPTAPPAGDSAGSSDLSQSSTSVVE